MIASLAACVARSPGGRRSLLLAALAAGAVLALSPGPLAPAAARAALAALALAAGAALLRRAPRSVSPPALAIVARTPLAGAAGVAVVEADGRRLLVGFGRDGVSLVAELDVPRKGAP